MANLKITPAKLQALRADYNRRARQAPGKYPRQKMLPEYQSLYPWVLADEADPYFAFCTVCECRLSAKRSDLGKHEGSIKHTENALKRCLDGSGGGDDVGSGDGLVLKGCHLQESNEAEAEDNETCLGLEHDEDDIKPYIKQEAGMDFMETVNEPFAVAEYSDAGDDDEANPEEEEDEDVPLTKRRRHSQSMTTTTATTDTNTQHSNTLDYQHLSPAVHLTAISKQNTTPQHFSIREITSGISSYAATPVKATVAQTSQYAAATQPPKRIVPAQAPCKIQIKKIITAPIAQVPQPPTAKLSIQSVPAPQPPNPVRDSFALFFDSICASVRALPPKLAVEGKIRVMQLIGELEMRALAENNNESGAAAVLSQLQTTVASSTTK